MWYMLYSGINVHDEPGMGLATSMDGETWKKHRLNPILKLPVPSLAPGGCPSGMTFAAGLFILMLHAIPADSVLPTNYQPTHVAVSRDLLDWTTYPAPILTKTLPTGEGIMEKAAIVATKDFFYLYWVGGDALKEYDVYLARVETHPPLTNTVLSLASLGAGASTALDDCLPIETEDWKSLAITCEASFATGATAGLRVHLRTSMDNVDYDEDDLDYFDVTHRPGAVGRKTAFVETDMKFLKVIVENLDTTNPVSDLKVKMAVR